jgi:hypothetical protein
MDAKLVIDFLLFLLTTAVAIFAIRDTRKQVHKMILLDRNRAYVKILNDMAWLVIDPTDAAHTPEIAKGMQEFGLAAQEAEPEWTNEAIKEAVDNESLVLADKIVNGGYATWKIGLDTGKVKKKLADWQTNKNRERIGNLFGKKEKFRLF